MRGGQDRLIKEIDALTYNARSTINALIRSVVVSGTNNGYTVKKAGLDISLSRVDIYRLYKFYQEWEASSFDADLFSSILTDQNSTFVTDETGLQITTATTDALIKHSKILYLNSDNLDMATNSDYWIGLIKTATNKKLISNTAPIPLNLRTPVFDENLSTAKYDQYETYLFPFSYYTADLLGYSGDGISHSLNGESWDVEVDSYFNIQSDAIAMGGVNESDVFKTKNRRNHDVDNNGNAYTITYSFASGYDTQARATYSRAGGLSSLVPRGAVGGIADGYRELASDSYAAAIGGFANKAVGTGSGVFAGKYNFSAGSYSGILGGINCATGDSADGFIFPGSDASSSSCIVLNEEECSSISNGSTVGRSLIALTGNLSSKYYIGDTVLLHTFTCYSDSGSHKKYWELNGDAYQSQQLLVASVQYLDPDLYPTNTNRGYTLVTLSGDVVGSGKVDGGYISRIKDKDGVSLGYASVAMNNSTIALGPNQTVVGKYNSPLQDALFIVGNGDGSGEYIKSNVMVVRESGVSIYGTPSNDSISAYIDFTVNYIGISGIVENSGIKITSIDSNLYSSAYIGLFTSNDNNDYNVLLCSDDKPLILRSGVNSEYSFTPTDMDIALLSDNDAIVSANGNVFVNGDGYVLINSDSDDVILSWDKNLQLIGNTFGSLPTTDEQFSHIVNGDNITAFTEKGSDSTIHGIIRTGFYDVRSYYNESINTDSSITAKYDTLRMLTLGDKATDDTYNAWKLIFPVIKDSTDSLPHIKVAFNELSASGAETNISKARAPAYLAYLDDIKTFGLWDRYDSTTATIGLFAGIYFTETITVTSGETITITTKQCAIVDTASLDKIIPLFKVSRIGNTMIMQLQFDITHLKDGTIKDSSGDDVYAYKDDATTKIVTTSFNVHMNMDSDYWNNNEFDSLYVDDANICAPTGSVSISNNVSGTISPPPPVIARFTSFGDAMGICFQAYPYGIGHNTDQLKYKFTLIGEMRVNNE